MRLPDLPQPIIKGTGSCVLTVELIEKRLKELEGATSVEAEYERSLLTQKLHTLQEN